MKPESLSLRLIYIKMANSLLILLHRQLFFQNASHLFFHVFQKDALLKVIKNIELLF